MTLTFTDDDALNPGLPEWIRTLVALMRTLQLAPKLTVRLDPDGTIWVSKGVAGFVNRWYRTDLVPREETL